MDIRIKDIIQLLDTHAPQVYSESYDNPGLLCGNPGWKATGALICLDSIESVIDEAIQLGCNLVIAHHPVIFSGLKKITGKTYIERTIIKAIKNDIAIYAIHTNLDNITDGVNRMIGERLKLKNLKILRPMKNRLTKLVTFCPGTNLEEVKRALFTAGAGNIGNYSECSFIVEGTGTFKGNEKSNPFVGEKDKRHSEPESRIEVIFESRLENSIMKALRAAHPYEEIAFYLTTLNNEFQVVGSGMSGDLEKPMDEMAFLNYLYKKMNATVIRHTSLTGNIISKVAICGGAGSFLLNDAINADCQVFITSDFKYHQFFDADRKILITDIGHYESEQYTGELIYNLIRNNLPKFALHLTKQVTNPVHYYYQHGH